jgi:hypothetical protein
MQLFGAGFQPLRHLSKEVHQKLVDPAVRYFTKLPRFAKPVATNASPVIFRHQKITNGINRRQNRLFFGVFPIPLRS